MSKDTVTLTKREYFNLSVAAEELRMLHNGGVDNWEWYGESLNPENEPSFLDIEDELSRVILGK